MRKLLVVFILVTTLLFSFCKEPEEASVPNVVAELLLPESALAEYEKNIDHKLLLSSLDDDSYRQGQQIYANVCFSCHGNINEVGSIPNSVKFWEDELKHGSDPYAMYETITRGYGLMPPQVQLVPKEKYAVIQFIREKYIKEHNQAEYVEIDTNYLATLPAGTIEGPASRDYQPWRDMDYGSSLINTYELSYDGAPPREISGGPSPLKDEKLNDINFAYKGIAIRLDEGAGGIAKGKAFIVFDQDLMRVAGAFTGDGFIDYEAILMNERHNIYPRTVGDLQHKTPVAPAWANPATGDWKDPRFVAVDGRPFGPLPKSWTHYKGLYKHGDKVVLSYTVGETQILESFNYEQDKYFTRNLNISASTQELKLRAATLDNHIEIMGAGATLTKDDGYHLVKVAPNKATNIKIIISPQADDSSIDLASFDAPEALDKYTKGGAPKYPETLETEVMSSTEDEAYVVDVLSLPTSNKWDARVRPTGIDFVPNSDEAYVCTIDGDVWHVNNITTDNTLQWKRIATGMFQPLGIKYHKGEIYVGCRNEIVQLVDLNGDAEIDFYKSFNNDHQVTEHFHEFAMGLQVDKEDNFYYAKSARHARTPLIPQHGTLLKVSPDGSTSEIIAHGFRAANGVCMNPDGSFYVTDQEGHWNPMNRINRVTEGGFYGNMYGYGAPSDTTDEAMMQPLVWIDMRIDRSPSELVWADTKKWGELNGKLLNLSYGYGKIYAVFEEEVKGQMQGGMIELSIPQAPTGLVRARFHPEDGQMYACGMTAWATSQVLQAGGLYRIRKTENPLNMVTNLKTYADGIRLDFANPVDAATAQDVSSYEVSTWQLKRTKRYGSKRFDEKILEIKRASLDGKSVYLEMPNIDETWIMQVKYQLEDNAGKSFDGTIQNSIFNLPNEKMQVAL